jgi:hypothetical protein
MTRSLAKIREQLTQLEAQTQAQWHGLAQTYDQYAQRLGQTLQQQAVYAVYQICTQIYPEAFLKVSYSDRQTFQQSIRTAIADFYDHLITSLNKRGITLDLSKPLAEEEPEAEANDGLLLLEDDLNNLNLSSQEQDLLPEDASPSREIRNENNAASAKETESTDETFPSMEEIKAFLSEALEKEGLSLEMLIPKMLRLDHDQTPIVVQTPDDLVQWHRQVEKLLQRSLVSLSMRLNHSLTTQKIIPENLPPRVLEMALQAEDERLIPNREKMPHIVNLLIETAHKTLSKIEDEDGEDNEDAEQPEPDVDIEDNNDGEDNEEESLETVRGEVSRLTVINLRLTDLEFSDVNLSMIRKKIRTYLNDLKKLRQQYRQLSQNRLTAEAELAWRSSWTATETSNFK